MTAQLTVIFRDPARSLDEFHPSAAAAAETVAALAARMGAEIQPGPLGKDCSGHLLRDRDIDAPIRISEVVAEYSIEEI